MLALSSRSPKARSLLEAAADLAAKLHADWFVVHVRQPSTIHYRMPATEHPVPEEDLAYAKKLGARVIIEQGAVIDALITFARKMSVNYFVTGRTLRSRIGFVWKLPLAEAVQRKLPGATLIVV